MDGTKIWWQSKTVWGAIIALAAGLAAFAGIDVDAALQDQLADIVIGAANLIAAALAWLGRVKARQILRWRR